MVVIIGVIGAVIFFAGRGKEEEENTPQTPSLEEHYSVTLEDMYANIKDSKKILKVKMTVQTTVPENQPVIESRQFVIRDEANKILRNTSEDDLAGSGYENARRAIEKTIQRYFGDESIVVFFDDFVFQ